MVKPGRISKIIRLCGVGLLVAMLSGGAGGFVRGGVIGLFVGVSVGCELGFLLMPLSLLLLRKSPLLVFAWLSAAAIPTALFSATGSNSFETVRNAAVVSYCLAVFLIVFFLPNKKYGKPGHCNHCDYDLTGNVSGTCPECGTPIAKED
ncbi:MAG: hypothetical protein HY287_17575 [Planctomycetes bacterium]|nr:hypothetical protein [Planctomycetota bacterium]